MNVSYRLIRSGRNLLGTMARLSPVKTSRFGYPDHILETAPWLEKETGDAKPSYVSEVRFLPQRPIRTVTPPRRVREADPLLWEWTQNWQPRPRYVVTLDRARVSGNAVIGPDHAILWPLSHLWDVVPAKHPLLQNPVLPSEIRLSGRSLLLSVDSADNYFHWLLDLLQKFKVVEDSGIDYLGFDHYLVNSQAREFQRESLKRFGIPPEKIVETGRLRNLLTETLTVPSWAEQSGVFDPEDVEWVRAKLVQPERNVAATTPERIFISRQRTRGRNLANFSQLATVLKKNAVTVVELETLGFSEQIRLFRDAKLVVGAHGAGLTNLLFCERGAKVLEFVNQQWPCQMYYYLAAVRGLDHGYLVGSVDKNVEPVFQDLTVDTELAGRHLDSWIGNSEAAGWNIPASANLKSNLASG